MEIDEIETFYKKENDKNEKEFLSKIQNAKDKKIVEDEYREKAKNIRRIYEKKYDEYLKEQRNKIEKKKRKKEIIKKEDFKVFEVKKFDFKPTFKEKFSYRWELFWFKYEIKKNNFFSSITPNFLKILYIKIKVSFKSLKLDTFRTLSIFFRELKEAFTKFILKSTDAVISIFKLVVSIIKGFFLKISNIFKTNKKSERRELRPDEEIAERLLAKK